MRQSSRRMILLSLGSEGMACAEIKENRWLHPTNERARILNIRILNDVAKQMVDRTLVHRCNSRHSFDGSALAICLKSDELMRQTLPRQKKPNRHRHLTSHPCWYDLCSSSCRISPFAAPWRALGVRRELFRGRGCYGGYGTTRKCSSWRRRGR